MYSYALNASFTACINTLRPRQNGCHFADDIFKCIFVNENVWILIKISLKFIPKGPINNIPALVQIMAWRRPGDKPWSGPIMVSLSMHIYITRPQWVEQLWPINTISYPESGSTLDQMMDYCLQALKYYLIQCSVIINKIITIASE